MDGAKICSIVVKSKGLIFKVTHCLVKYSSLDISCTIHINKICTNILKYCLYVPNNLSRGFGRGVMLSFQNLPSDANKFMLNLIFFKLFTLSRQ